MVDPQMMHDTLAQVRAHAVDAGRPADAVRGALFAWTCVDEDRNWAREIGVATVSAAYAQDFSRLADRYLLLGTPDDVVGRLKEFADAGAERVLIQIAAPPAERERVFGTLAREVLPGCSSAAAGTEPRRRPGAEELRAEVGGIGDARERSCTAVT
jgi:alkanesulfonate monooxygenase SsuD/methylene tetrahydromethanopterin reductase-like flavin-dependent oxidoreductase (luciferase family)